MEGMLSQEEINALLSGMEAGSLDGGGDSPEEQSGGDTTTSQPVEELLTPEEKDAIGEVANISMGTAATTLFTLLNTVVDITVPQVSYARWDDLVNAYDKPCVFVQLSYIDGIDGNNVLILKEQDVKIITDLMMGGDGTNVADELSDLHLSAISEAMNQMMGSSATSLSQMLGKKVDISPPVASLVDLNEGIADKGLSDYLTETFVRVTFKMKVGELIDSEIMQLYPIDLAKEIYTAFSGAAAEVASEPAPAQAPAPEPQAAPAPAPAPQTAAPPPQMDPNAMAAQMPYGQPQMMPYGYAMPPMGDTVVPQGVAAPSAQFSPFAMGMPNPVTQQENIDLIKDVPLDVTVELGKTKKSIREILDISPGTIIELDKLAGEPVDVIVNGKNVAKGEVVVIEESFGVRVTEIYKQQ
ncbi:MAG: flagellar motor switch phosphatase FliY [Lachnospiraceae bacterium]|nr:flagellar motor switch phosphatase FliY [Lachnospiraceae bacterium]